MELKSTQKFDDMLNDLSSVIEKRRVESEKRRQNFIQRMEILRGRQDKLTERRIQRMRNDGIDISFKEFRNKPDVKALRKAGRLHTELGKISLKLAARTVIAADRTDSKRYESEQSGDSETDSDREMVDCEKYGISSPVSSKIRTPEIQTPAKTTFRPVITVKTEPRVGESETGGLLGKESSTEVKQMISRIGQLSLSALKPSSVRTLSKNVIKDSSFEHQNTQVARHNPWNVVKTNTIKSEGQQALGATEGIQTLAAPAGQPTHGVPAGKQTLAVPEISVEESNHRRFKHAGNETNDGGNLNTPRTATVNTPRRVISDEIKTVETKVTDSDHPSPDPGVLENLLHHVMNDPTPENISMLKQLISDQGEEGVDLSLLEPFMTEAMGDEADNTFIEEDEKEETSILKNMQSDVKTVRLKVKKQKTKTKASKPKGRAQSRQARSNPDGEKTTENFALVEAFLNKHSDKDTSHSKANESLKRARIKLAVIKAMGGSV